MWGVCDTFFHYMFLDLQERLHSFLILLATGKLFPSIWVPVHSPIYPGNKILYFPDY